MDKDTLNKRYFSDNRRYADLINGFIFQGEQMICANDLGDMDSQAGVWKNPHLPGVEQGESEKSGRHKSIYRDLIRKTAFGMNFAVIGIEKQEEVHYLMPLRSMAYDTEEYKRQAAAIRRAVRERENVSRAEFLSGFEKSSRLHPCVTLVLFFGKEWDGSRDLHGVLDFTGIPEKLKRLVNNYPIHLMEVYRLKNTEVFQTDVKLVFDFIRYSEDKKKLEDLVRQNSAYKEMDEDAYDMIATYTNAKKLTDIKKQYEMKGKVNMCKALDELIEDGRNAGRREGRQEGKREGRKEGKLQGMRAGNREGIKKINRLNQKLIKDGRMDELIQASRDSKLQNLLLAEYNL